MRKTGKEQLEVFELRIERAHVALDRDGQLVDALGRVKHDALLAHEPRELGELARDRVDVAPDVARGGRKRGRLLRACAPRRPGAAASSTNTTASAMGGGAGQAARAGSAGVAARAVNEAARVEGLLKAPAAAAPRGLRPHTAGAQRVHHAVEFRRAVHGDQAFVSNGTLHKKLSPLFR